MSGIVWDNLNEAMGALAADTVLRATSRIDAGRLQGFRLLRTEYHVAARNMTSEDGPIHFGLAVDLSVAEILECLNADPQRSNDVNLSEQAKRPVFPMGILFKDGDGNGQSVVSGVSKIGWSVPEGVSLFWYFHNMDLNTITTGTIVSIIAKHFGVWLKD